MSSSSFSSVTLIISSNKLEDTCVSWSSASCSSKFNLMETPTYSSRVRSTGDKLGLQLVSAVCACWGRQSCGNEPVTCGIWSYHQVNNIRTELSFRTPSWCYRELLGVGRVSTHLVMSSVRSEPIYMSSRYSKWSQVKSLSHVRLFVTPWTVAYQAPPSLGFSRQEYWSGPPFPSPGDLHSSELLWITTQGFPYIGMTGLRFSFSRALKLGWNFWDDWGLM